MERLKICPSLLGGFMLGAFCLLCLTLAIPTPLLGMTEDEAGIAALCLALLLTVAGYGIAAILGTLQRTWELLDWMGLFGTTVAVVTLGTGCAVACSLRLMSIGGLL